MCTRVALSGFMCREVSRPAASALPPPPPPRSGDRSRPSARGPEGQAAGTGALRGRRHPACWRRPPPMTLRPVFQGSRGARGPGAAWVLPAAGSAPPATPPHPWPPDPPPDKTGRVHVSARPSPGQGGGALRHPRGWAPKAFPRRAPFFLSDPGQHAPSGGTDPSARRQDGDRPRGGLRAPRATSPSRRPLRGAGGTHGGAGPRATCLRPRPEPWPGRGARCLPGYSARPAPPVLPALAAPARSAFSKMVALGSG